MYLLGGGSGNLSISFKIDIKTRDIPNSHLLPPFLTLNLKP